MQEKALRWISKGQRRNAEEVEEEVEEEDEEEDGRTKKQHGDRMRCERWWQKRGQVKYVAFVICTKTCMNICMYVFRYFIQHWLLLDLSHVWI